MTSHCLADSCILFERLKGSVQLDTHQHVFASCKPADGVSWISLLMRPLQLHLLNFPRFSKLSGHGPHFQTCFPVVKYVDGSNHLPRPTRSLCCCKEVRMLFPAETTDKPAI